MNDRLCGDAIRAAVPRTIDEMLAREPSFSLYRRQSAVFGNPTSAGVSLRNTGATAAARTLVLLDGVPQIEPSASLEYRRGFSDFDARISAGTGFRLPTLNELHRPFRVRSDIVEANPGLDPERFISLEAGVDWNPHVDLTSGLALFHHWIRDAIANVPVTDPAEISAIITPHFPALRFSPWSLYTKQRSVIYVREGRS